MQLFRNALHVIEIPRPMSTRTFLQNSTLNQVQPIAPIFVRQLVAINVQIDPLDVMIRWYRHPNIATINTHVDKQIAVIKKSI
jgi:hypothetical protein